jgi:drug/metabolite transporter (DMT)-like permease
MGYILQIFSVSINAIAILINKYLLVQMPPSMVALGNIVFSILMGLVFWREVQAELNLKTIRIILRGALINAIGQICFYVSLQNLAPVTFGLLGRFYIVFALIIAMIIFNEKFSAKEYCLILLSIIGGVCFTIREEEMSYRFVYIVICLAAYLCFALSFALIKKNSTHVKPRVMFFYNNLFILLPTLCYCWFRNDLTTSLNLNSYILLICAAVFVYSSLLMFFKSLNYISFTHANLLRSLSPIILAIISVPFFPEKLSSLNLLGAALIFGSLIMLSHKKKSA